MSGRKYGITVPRIYMSFPEAARQAGPWTPHMSAAKRAEARARGEILLQPLIWRAGRMYRHIHNPLSGDVTLTLLNFGPRSATVGPKALRIGKVEGLEPASPFEIFSLGVHCPLLYQDLGMDPCGILSPMPQMLEGVNRVCCVWLGSTQKECAFVPFDYPLHDGYWFAFKA